ncbi:MAG: acyltransferase family protein [Lachnospiraceae bacterium]|nr:acyltransferase family protein [Lachnospiraceae bacterium]
MKTKNHFIELLRFVFCMVIVFHHSGFLAATQERNFPFKSAGFFAVEFFFILTGALAMKHIREANGRENLKSSDSNEEAKTNKNTNLLAEAPMKYSLVYTINKLKRVFPYAMCGIILSYIWYFISCDSGLGFKDKLLGGLNIVYELLFIPMTGVMKVGLESFMNAPLWYLSVILIALPLILYMAIRFKDSFDNYISIIVPLLLHAYLINLYGSIGNWGTYTTVAYSGVIRGLADLMLGCLAYNLSVKIAESNKISRAILTLFEIVMYAFSIYTFTTNVDGYVYEFAILILVVAIAISLSAKSMTANLKGYVFSHLGAISLPIYCLHWPVYRFITLYCPNIDYVTGVIVVIAVCVALSEILMILLKGFAALKIKENVNKQ